MLAQAIRAALLDGRVYKEIGDEPEAMFRALGVVVGVAIAFGLGIMSTPFQGLEDSPGLVLAVAISTAMLSWLLWASVAYLIGTRVLGGQASHRMLLRALGIAYTPGILLVLVSVPVLGDSVRSVSLLWLLASGMVAVRETQGYGWLKALFPSVAGWFVAWLLLPTVFLQPLGELSI